jgi:tetratricopeptide (TPR) repeat protein
VKKGAAARATRLLEDALERHKPDAPQETIGFVEEHSRLARALGDAYEAAGQPDGAKRAWRVSVHGWERLMVEHLRRKNLDESSEAFVEVGRLYYLLGRREEGIQKFQEAIEQNEGRDQSYIDPLAFLVERGEVDAATDIFRRALGRPSKVVSEYVKTYAALWVLDLTRRSGRSADPTAEAYLRALDARKVALRPPRASAWYVPLAGFAVGRRSYDDLTKLATNQGRRAELYFYEAMRRLGDGKADDAHRLWTQVIETNMVSFFEFEMAARYLRSGAPTRPPATEETPTETI